MGINTAQLVIDMKAAASAELNADVSAFRGFSERQLEAIAKQTEFVAIGIATKQITEETKDFFLDAIEDMSLNFVKTLRGLILATVEKVWNALVGVIWKALSDVTGLVLPVPVARIWYRFQTWFKPSSNLERECAADENACGERRLRPSSDSRPWA